MYRTNTNVELNKKHIDTEAKLCGWVHSRRDHGGIIFIDLRDRYGVTQIVFDPEFNKDSHSTANALRREDVIAITGTVKPRKEGMINAKLPTGEVEVFASDLNIINKAQTPPIEIDDRIEASEDIRLKYRYLDLRRPVMQNRLRFRHDVVTAARDFFNKSDFLEIETPLMVKSTPEGARDYVIPSRVNPGEFYALPQSPQLYKQILMIAGFDKYYQVAKCLRDEDLRNDRQPEHTQFDLEMSFVKAEDVRAFVEKLFKHIFKTVIDTDLEDFPVLTYKECMERFGTDKPDTRFGLELTNVTEIVAKSDFGVFKDVKDNGGIVKAIVPEKEFPRKEIDKYIGFCQEIGAKGMAWMRVTENGLESNIAKYFNEDIQKELIDATKAKPGSVIMFIADKEKSCNDVISRLRLKLGEDMEIIPKDKFNFLWVNDFPLFAYNEQTKSWAPEHHMFSMPKEEFIETFDKDPAPVIGDLWDLVLNGSEMGSGSIRISSPDIQERVMNLIGISKEEAQTKFGFLLDAYKYGAPVHGGMGLGVDRLVAMMQGFTDIREVIAFPKNKNAQCPMDESPSGIDEKQLKELHIKLDVIKKIKEEK